MASQGVPSVRLRDVARSSSLSRWRALQVAPSLLFAGALSLGALLPHLPVPPPPCPPCNPPNDLVLCTAQFVVQVLRDFFWGGRC